MAQNGYKIKPGKTAKTQAGANATLVEREKLIYPLASLVSKKNLKTLLLLW